jgi:class 3 adenylate cyclase
LTLLFTDLKGSTAMYERIGDLKAFSLVQQHFDRLGKAIQGNNGAIVKTIGDAVMATFNTPVGAVTAALQMLDEIEAFNKEHGAQALILKIGIHHGTSIAVTLNDRLDYLGQTVNIAARVQGLAGAEEIYITKDVFDSPGVKEHLTAYQVTPESAMLKGVAGAMQVNRITEKGRAPASAASKPAAKPAKQSAARPKPKARAAARKAAPKRKPARR